MQLPTLPYYSLFVLNRVKGKLPSSTSWAIFKRLLHVISATLITSGVFYWRIRGITNCEVGFDTWVIALDISFAHLVLTLPLLLTVLSVVLPPLSSIVLSGVTGMGKGVEKSGVGEYVGLLLALPGIAVIDYESTENKTLWRAIIQVGGYVYLFLIAVIALYGVYWVMRFLLIDTMDLQLMLFGAYDGSIGWQYPTTFRFAVLHTHVKETIQVLAGNEVLAVILSFAGFVIFIIVTLASIMKAVQTLGRDTRHKE